MEVTSDDKQAMISDEYEDVMEMTNTNELGHLNRTVFCECFHKPKGSHKEMAKQMLLDLDPHARDVKSDSCDTSYMILKRLRNRTV